VGHTDYRYLRWQVIDTPGILDHPLEQRNTIEMQAITALAHLTCSVLYFLDISEQCGYTIEQQCSLFRSIQPLFANKQLIIVINKIDAQPWDTLDTDKKQMIEALVSSSSNNKNTTLMTMSNMSEQGVSEVKAAACDRLLAARVESRISPNKVSNVMNRLQVFYPSARDSLQREAYIPDSVLHQQTTTTNNNNNDESFNKSRIGYAPTVKDDDNEVMEEEEKKKTARELMWENGGPGVWAPDYREQYDLKNPEWKFDAIPELLDGKNIADYIDPDIDAKLEALEREEEQFIANAQAAAMEEDPESDLDSEEEAAVQAIRERKNTLRTMSHVNKSQNRPIQPRIIRNRPKDRMHDVDKLSADQIRKDLDDKFGIDTTDMIQNRATTRGRKRTRRDDDDDDDDDDMSEDAMMELSKTQAKKKKKQKQESKRRTVSLARSHDQPKDADAPTFNIGLKDETAARIAKKLDQRGKKSWASSRQGGEGDQRKSVHLVKWMNTGKKRQGTHYCR
jgi:nucleolar GTP-binding protein